MRLRSPIPGSYEARSFAGDVYFRKGDTEHAGEWFQKAIDVDPNAEQAYRYWGDTLMKAGRKEPALDKFIDAVVADPYGRNSWMGLRQWAQATGATLTRPPIHLPQAPAANTKGSKPGITLNLSSETLKASPDVAAAALIYSVSRATWRTETFAKNYPAEKTYRHTLAEEVDAITLMVSVLEEAKNPVTDNETHLTDLIPMSKEGLVPAYVLINGADEGIAKDYPTYRNEHRELLHAYVRKYVVLWPAAT